MPAVADTVIHIHMRVHTVSAIADVPCPVIDCNYCHTCYSQSDLRLNESLNQSCLNTTLVVHNRSESVQTPFLHPTITVGQSFWCLLFFEAVKRMTCNLKIVNTTHTQVVFTISKVYDLSPFQSIADVILDEAVFASYKPCTFFYHKVLL